MVKRMKRILREYRAFTRAVKEGELYAVKAYLDVHPECLDRPNTVGRTPLHWAAKNGATPMVEWLLQRGSTSFALRDAYGNTPLIWAAINRRDATVAFLIQWELNRLPR